MITAEEARTRTISKAQKMALAELKEIEELIENAIEDCTYSISQDGVLSQVCKNQLESMGYKVETGTQYNQPWYNIKW